VHNVLPIAMPYDEWLCDDCVKKNISGTSVDKKLQNLPEWEINK
jgi:hypothetical protein